MSEPEGNRPLFKRYAAKKLIRTYPIDDSPNYVFGGGMYYNSGVGVGKSTTHSSSTSYGGGGGASSSTYDERNPMAQTSFVVTREDYKKLVDLVLEQAAALDRLTNEFQAYREETQLKFRRIKSRMAEQEVAHYKKVLGIDFPEIWIDQNVPVINPTEIGIDNIVDRKGL